MVKVKRRSFTALLKNMSLRKSFIVLTILSLLVALILSTISIQILERIYEPLYKTMITNANIQHYLQPPPDAPKGTVPVTIAIGYMQPGSPQEAIVLRLISALNLLLPLLFFVISVTAAAAFFYKLKLKQPIGLLNDAANQISANNLDFSIQYDKKDEMGRLVDSFERMRSELKSSQQAMWRMMEERKRLNAAFAHDLRTPVTVLKGYTDLLTKYMPEGRIEPERLVSTLSFMSDHIHRLETYVDSMNTLQQLEHTEVHAFPQHTGEFARQLAAQTEMLSKQEGKTYELRNLLPASMLSFDDKIVFRTAENLLTNAFRYARSHVLITCEQLHDELVLNIFDDGPGFNRDELELTTRPFYTKNPSGGESHFGLGLNIAKTLCERHGGSLRLSNAEGKGARVTASFSAKVDKT
ncbi:HAMP domain-containing protein [Paenibacillus sp. HJL G12]|uniref:histidine kinase n=1 Tax=Paenibacillus dendrobii TaxID=2691084 RepID=A0A7X3ILA8_9BACL|nr:HAMP domain-containing sensor histidine kinase [Paenibacillus dendrobii]MWV46014.1 HAMP domain-containing protein [Paenibacillus dendrobii]